MLCRKVLNPAPDEFASIACRQVTGAEMATGAARLVDAVDPEAAPVVAVEVPCNEVPASPEQNEAMGLHPADRAPTIPGCVGELQIFDISAGLRDRDEVARVDARCVARPSGGNGHRGERIHTSTKPRGHHLNELGKCSHRRLGDSHDRVTLHRSVQAHAERHGFVVVEDQGRKSRAGGELVAAVDAPLRFNWITEVAQAVDVASQCPKGDLESIGKFDSRSIPMGLQQRKETQRPRARSGHDVNSCAI